MDKIRERTIRNKMADELYKDGCKEDYEMALSDNYDFTYCPDEYEFLAEHMDDFKSLCNEFNAGDKEICDQCWKGFLSGVKC